MNTYVFGYTPGHPAVMIEYIVLTEQTEFSKWFVLFTPLVTISWVAEIGFLIMPMPWGLYFAGSFGTWIILILVMNLAATIALWNLDDADAYTKIYSD